MLKLFLRKEVKSLKLFSIMRVINSMTQIPSLPVKVDEGNFREDAIQVLKVVRPKWTRANANQNHAQKYSQIKCKVFTEGLSNKLVGFWIESNPEDVVIVKVFGSNTETLIDRKAEIETMRILHDRKCGAQLYATFENGICYEYMNGNTLEVDDCRDSEIYPLVAAEMAHMHSTFKTIGNGHGTNDADNDTSIDIANNNGTNVKMTTNKNGVRLALRSCPLWGKLKQFNILAEESLREDKELTERLLSLGVSRGWAAGAIDELHSLMEKEEMPVTFCHNDLIPRNIVYDKKKKRVTFIDVEYAMPNYPAFDVANHFLEFAGVPDLDYSRCPDKEFRLRWIAEYLKNLTLDDYSSEKVSVELFNRWVELCMPASHLFWGLWAIHQAKHSTIEFDYVQYVGKRFSEFKKCMQSIRAGSVN